MLKSKFRYIIITAMSILALTACQKAEVIESSTVPETSATELRQSFTDDDGREINVKSPFKKIISMYSAHTENLFELGVGGSVIGGHTTCVYPPQAAFLEKFDYNADPETVIAASPDLVLIRPFITKKAPDYVKTLEQAGITVVSLYPETYEEFPDYIHKLAILTGSEKTAEEKLKNMENSIKKTEAAVKDIEKKENVFFEATETNVRTIAKGSMADRAIEFAGGINIAKDAAASSSGGSIADFGVENVLKNGDSIDVYISQRGAMNSGGDIESICQRPGYDTIKAVKNSRVFLINEKLISSPTFRYAKGIEEMARYLYPDIMDDISQFSNNELITRENYSKIVTKAAHLPIYLPTSSKYYNTKRDSHTFGLFTDVSSTDPNFDSIETAVYGGYVDWIKKEGGEECFMPLENVTREQLAKTVFLLGDFKSGTSNTLIKDLESCEKPKIIQILVDNGILTLEDGNFNPQRPVTSKEVVAALNLI